MKTPLAWAAILAGFAASCIGSAKGLVGFKDPADDSGPYLSLEPAVDADQPGTAAQGRTVYASATAGDLLSVVVVGGTINISGDDPPDLAKTCRKVPELGILPITVIPASADGAMLYVALVRPLDGGTAERHDAGIENACLDSTSIVAAAIKVIANPTGQRGDAAPAAQDDGGASDN